MLKRFNYSTEVDRHYTNPENPKQQYYPHVIEVVDDDFRESIKIDVLGTPIQAFSIWKGSVAAVISIYSKRELEVLPNLFVLIKYFLYERNASGNITLEDITEELLEFVPAYREYHSDILRYFNQKAFW